MGMPEETRLETLRALTRLQQQLEGKDPNLPGAPVGSPSAPSALLTEAAQRSLEQSVAAGGQSGGGPERSFSQLLGSLSSGPNGKNSLEWTLEDWAQWGAQVWMVLDNAQSGMQHLLGKAKKEQEDLSKLKRNRKI